MSRTQNLRHNVVNQMLEGISRQHIRSPLPPQSALAEMFNVSRTTVRHTLAHLYERGVLDKVEDQYLIVRLPEQDDGFDAVSSSLEVQSQQFEQAFFQMINQRVLRAGESISELQLAQQVGVSPVVVREFQPFQSD